jgi:hypothetical protein
MNQCKLILVEGIPGSGKTTQAGYIKAMLDGLGIPNRLFLEGNPDHPADFESVAYFTSTGLEAFLDEHEPHRKWLEQAVIARDDDYFVSYGKVKGPSGHQAFDRMVSDLARHDVYEICDPETFQRLTLDRWWDFVDEAAHRNEVTIFECAFLQNPLTSLIAKYNLPMIDVRKHIEMLAAIVRPLHPVLVYLWQENIHETLEQAAQQRPEAWKKFVIRYLTGQAWGKAVGANGYDGVVEFYEMRKTVEQDILAWLDINQMQLNTTSRDWADSQKLIGNFVLAALEKAQASEFLSISN